MKKFTLLLPVSSTIILAALAVQTSSAQPTGSITNLITGSSNVLWDVSRLTNQLINLDLTITQTRHGTANTLEIAYTDEFTQNGRGKLAGSGTNDVQVTDGSGSVSFPGHFTTRGSLTSAKGVAHLTFMSRVSGRLALPGSSKTLAASAMAIYVVKLDANSDQVTGRAIKTASARGHTISQTSPIGPSTVSSLMPELGDGTWALELDFGTATGDKLSGSASVTLNSGTVYRFSFTGVFNSQTGQSKLNLKGVDAGQGSSLQVVLDGSTITRITGQVSGQLVNVK